MGIVEIYFTNFIKRHDQSFKDTYPHPNKWIETFHLKTAVCVHPHSLNSLAWPLKSYLKI